MLIIFDFDGTLVNTLDLIEKLMLEAAPRYNLAIPSTEIQAKARNEPTRQARKTLGLSHYQAFRLVRYGRRHMKTRLAEIPANPAMGKALAQIHCAAQAHNAQLCVLTSNSTRAVKQRLSHNGWADYFVHIKGDVRLMGKPRAMRKLARRSGGPVLSVGDDLRDAAAARKTGSTFLAVGWGHHTLEQLKIAGAYYCAKSPQNMFFCIEKWLKTSQKEKLNT